MERQAILLRRIRWLLGLFMVGLVLSGLTAVPLAAEADLLAGSLGIASDASPESYTGLKFWIARVRQGLHSTYAQYPFVAYGTDWLAFAHVVIAIAFIGPLRDPVRNQWVITFGIVACLLVIPMALGFGQLRGIPLYWRLIDCSFGLVGLVPLWLCRRYVRELSGTAQTCRSGFLA